MHDIRLSILIVSYKTPALLVEAIESILRYPPKGSIEIIVVDNASCDGSTGQILRRFPQVIVIQNSFNYGFAVANNQAYRVSRGRYVMPMNADCTVDSCTLEAMLGYLESHLDVGLVCPYGLDDDGHLYPPAELRLFSPSGFFRRLSPRQYKTKSATPRETLHIWGTGYVCRRTALPPTHIFDEEMFLFGEEYRLCEEVRIAGYKIVSLPSAVIRHIVGASYKRDACSLAYTGMLGDAAAWLVKVRHYGRLRASINQLWTLLDAVLLWAALSVRAKMRHSKVTQYDARRAIAGRIVSSASLLLKGKRYVSEIDNKTRRFFNNGTMPPMPPVVATTYIPACSTVDVATLR